jgi:hypothetical protein
MPGAILSCAKELRGARDAATQGFTRSPNWNAIGYDDARVGVHPWAAKALEWHKLGDPAFNLGVRMAPSSMIVHSTPSDNKMEVDVILTGKGKGKAKDEHQEVSVATDEKHADEQVSVCTDAVLTSMADALEGLDIECVDGLDIEDLQSFRAEG